MEQHNQQRKKEQERAEEKRKAMEELWLRAEQLRKRAARVVEDLLVALRDELKCPLPRFGAYYRRFHLKSAIPSIFDPPSFNLEQAYTTVVRVLRDGAGIAPCDLSAMSWSDDGGPDDPKVQIAYGRGQEFGRRVSAPLVCAVLHHATYWGTEHPGESRGLVYLAMVKALLAAGANPLCLMTTHLGTSTAFALAINPGSMRDSHPSYPLPALNQHHVAAARLMVAHPCVQAHWETRLAEDALYMPLVYAHDEDDVPMVEMLAAAGAQVDGDMLVWAAHHSGAFGVRLVKLMLQYGADVTKPCKDGKSVLHNLLRDRKPLRINRDFDCAPIALLLELKAEVDSSLLHLNNRCPEAARLLMAAGADPNYELNGRTPLHNMYKASSDWVRVMIAGKADVTSGRIVQQAFYQLEQERVSPRVFQVLLDAKVYLHPPSRKTLQCSANCAVLWCWLATDDSALAAMWNDGPTQSFRRKCDLTTLVHFGADVSHYQKLDAEEEWDAVGYSYLRVHEAFKNVTALPMDLADMVFAFMVHPEVYSALTTKQRNDPVDYVGRFREFLSFYGLYWTPNGQCQFWECSYV